MSKRSRINKVRNFGFNTQSLPGSAANFNYSKKGVTQNLANYISPVQLQRLRTDVSMWRDAIREAEKAYYPFRVKMQRIFIDTILNGHVYSLLERRKDLTLLRDFGIYDEKGVESKVLTQELEEQPWFYDFQSYALDAISFGYSLISLGDIVDNQIQGVSLVPRWFISPDRHQVGSFIYATSGKDWREKPQSDWHVFVGTPSDSGVSPCGYGLLYQIALYEIFLRNTLGFNGDFVELYAMPYRVGKTTKTEESERAELERAIQDMGSAGYAIIDPMDDITFLETKLGGTGYQGYDNLEKRCEAKVSKIILGHADAMDSTPGKIGAGQGDDNPVAVALRDKQVKDARFMLPIVNKQLFPKLRNLGLTSIPEKYRFRYKNDAEEEAFRERQDKSNLGTAQIAKTMKDAGLKMSAEYFEERTGIPTEEVEVPEPLVGDVPDEDESEVIQSVKDIQNKINKLYGK
jgi:phage gp29-like protein